MNICPLCNKNPADNRNSHIIHKFLGKPLFNKVKPKYSLQVTREGKTRKIQDIPKEDFLICGKCEKRFEILETYFSKKLIAIGDYGNRKTQFKVSQIRGNNILSCLELNPLLFKLFYFSIIWRVSVTSNPLFNNFKLPKNIESEIGAFLNRNLFITHKELMDNANGISIFPKYHLIAYKPEKINMTFTGILAALQMSPNKYGIFTSDMILIFHLNEKEIGQDSEIITNKGIEKVKFIIANSEQWEKISRIFVQFRLLDNRD